MTSSYLAFLTTWEELVRCPQKEINNPLQILFCERFLSLLWVFFRRFLIIAEKEIDPDISGHSNDPWKSNYQ